MNGLKSNSRIQLTFSVRPSFFLFYLFYFILLLLFFFVENISHLFAKFASSLQRADGRVSSEVEIIFWTNSADDGLVIFLVIFPTFIFLTLVLLNPDIPCLCKQCRSRSVGF